MPATQNERTPLLGNNNQAPSSAAAEDNAVLAHESAFSAIQGAEHGVDPNSSAFLPPPDRSQLNVTPGEAVSEAEHGRPLGMLLLVMGAMWIGTFLAALDGTIVATILGTVGSEFGVSKTVGWLGTSYLLTQTAFQPLYGRLSDIFGRKPATLFASSVFLIGSLFCGLSRSFTQLCVARAIAGIGGGGLTSMATIVTSDLVSLKARGTWQGLGNLVFATGAAIGGPLGGALADGGIGWRWAFLVQVPLCMIHFGMVSWKINIPAGPGSVSEKLRRVDVWGALSLVSSVALVLVGLNLGGNELPWGHPAVLSSLIGGMLLAGVFVYVEKNVAREPLMPMSVLFNRTPGFVSLACWFISISQFGILFNVPLYFTAVAGTSASRAGMHLIPNAVTASACSLGSGLIMGRTGKYRKMMLAAGSLAVLGPLGMCMWNPKHTSEFAYWFTMPWGGAAFGSILTITLVALIASVDPKDMAPATGVTYLFRAVGSVLGISLSNTLLQNSLKANLRYRHVPSEIAEQIRDNVGFLHQLTGKLHKHAVQAYQDSMHAVFVWIALTGFLAFVCLFFIEEKPLPGHQPAARPQRDNAED
ncbi:hypothetical protein GLX27_001239 [Malassezia furfur]|uniref:Major facilitator superfamily (MFS) profile domain-containing protein n=1 Tax=Malassezia furfur TaxID=55194 RepID=A0ABY8EM20_MALFU|nr:hypothetical protein CBS14141_001094 [Malassezia furfur]WFD46602.1 hypothetical protein GLX27_001239 [Malassezia furfur]